MFVRAFTLGFCPERQVFQDEALVAFCADHQVLSLHQHLVTIEGAPFWGVLVGYRPRTRPGTAPRSPAMRGKDRTPVPEADAALFKALRSWRNQQATALGKPAYLIARNSVLADIARVRPGTLQALGEVHGVGEATLRDVGGAILEVVRLTTTADAGPDRQGAGAGAEPEHG